MAVPKVKLGAQLWPQTDSWPTLRDAVIRADRNGFDSLWTWDHLMAIVGPWQQPNLEGWTTLAAWASVTEHATLGLMVGANTFRNPGLTAKLAITLDHISDGRAILGIGGAWFEREHDAFGIEFGPTPGWRLDRLDAERIVLALEPGGTDARVGLPTVADVVEGDGELGREARVAERVGADHQAERGVLRHALPTPPAVVQPSRIGLLPRPDDGHEVIQVQRKSKAVPVGADDGVAERRPRVGLRPELGPELDLGHGHVKSPSE